MLFFVRAKILSQVDGHIAGKRGTTKLVKYTNPKNRQPIIDDIFDHLIKEGIEKDLIQKIDGLFEKFDFKNTPSVIEKIQWYQKYNPNSYDRLKKITLYDHTIRVVRIALNDQETEKNQRINIALFALLHDTGKSYALCDHYGFRTDKGHEKASADVINMLLRNTKYKEISLKFKEALLQIANVKNGKEPYKKFGIYGEALHRADSQARREELELLDKKESEYA